MNNKQNTISKIVLFVLFGIELIMWIYINLRLDSPYDQDSAKVIYHAVKMWESKSFVLPNWVYMTTGEWDCAAFLAMPIYGVTHNIFLSFALSNIINIALFTYIIITLFKSLRMDYRYAIITLLVILLPYSVGMLDYSNMLFFSAGQYIYKVLVPLCVITILDFPCNSKIAYFFCIFITALLILLTTTSSGVYTIVCGIFPIFLVRFVYYLGKKTIPPKRECISAFVIIVTTVLGVALHYYNGINSSADSKIFTNSSDLINNIQKCILDSVNVFGIFPTESIPVISLSCITRIIKLICVLLVFIFGWTAIKDFINIFKSAFLIIDKPYSFSSMNIIKAELISLPIINYFILMLTESSRRYLLIGIIPLIILSVITLSNIHMQQWCKYLAGIAFCLLMLLTFINFNKEYSFKFNPKTASKIIDLANTYQADNVVFFSSPWAEITRSMDTNLSCITYVDEENGFVDYDVYYGHKGLDTFLQNNIVCMEIGTEFSLPNYFDDYELCSTIDNFDIYINIK